MSRMRAPRGAAFVLIGLWACAPPSSSDPVDPLAVLERALDHVVSAEAGTVPVVYASGTLDQSGELQGTTPEGPDASEFHEAIAIRGPDEAAQELRHVRVDGTSDRIRETHGGGFKTIHVIPEAFTARLVSGPETGAGARVRRRFPHLLLAEAVEAARAGRVDVPDDPSDTLSLRFQIGTGTPLTLRLLRADSTLQSVSYDLTVPGLGDVVVEWTFGDFRRAGPVRVPFRYGATVDGSPFLEMRVDSVVSDSDRIAAFFETPPARDIDPGDDPSAGASVETVGDGIYIVRGLRTGFHPMFVEFDEFVVAMDAPAGYPLMLELPAGDVAPGPSPDWLSRRYIELIRETIPDKPIGYVVLTHFHNDHAGGVRAFIAEGATVIVGYAAEGALRRFYESAHDLSPDALSADATPLSLQTVDEPFTLSDGSKLLTVHPVDGNPHAADMLFVDIPSDGVAFESDLLNGLPADALAARADEPVISHVLDWLDERRIDPDRIYSMHGVGVIDRAARQAADGR